MSLWSAESCHEQSAVALEAEFQNMNPTANGVLEVKAMVGGGQRHVSGVGIASWAFSRTQTSVPKIKR